MKTRFSKNSLTLLLLLCLSLAIVAEGQAQNILSAKAKVAIVSDQTTVWSNDGSSKNGEEPLSSFPISISNGSYHFDLGGEPMNPIFTEYLAQFDNLRLKTWIDSGNGFQLQDEKAVQASDFTTTKKQLKQPYEHVPTFIRAQQVINHKIENKGKKLEKMAHAEAPDDRFKARWERKADTSGNIPYGKLLQAKRHIKQMAAQQTAIVGDLEWEWLGPGNIGGRIRSILIHPDNPNTMWIGAASGGIWRTNNGGNTWFPIDDFLPSLNVTSLVMDPANTNILYASTGEGFGNFWPDVPGAGIFKSIDGGTTWNQLAETNNDNFRWVTRLAHHPQQAGVLFATTRQGSLNNWSGTIYKSINGGETWINVMNTASPAYDVKIHKTNHSIVYVGTATGFLRSTSNGDANTWVIESTGAANKLPGITQRVEIAVGTNNPNVVYVSLERINGEIWRSTDAGNTWSLRSTGFNYCLGNTNQCWYDNAIWVNPFDSDFIVVGGIDLWRSTDGGQNLTQISRWQDYHNGGNANSAHADHHFIVEHPNFNNTTNRIVFFGNDGGIQKATNIATVSTNNGWTNLANNLGITQFYTGAASPSGDMIIGGSQDNSFMYLSNQNGTSNWIQPITGDGADCAVDFRNSDTLYASTQRMRIRKSVDGGLNWTLVTTGITESGTNNAPFIGTFLMDPNNARRLFALTSRIYRTNNGANSWFPVRGTIAGNFFASAIDIAKNNSQRIMAGYTNGTISISTNGGTIWADVNVGTPNRMINAIAINPANENEAIVAYAGYNANNLWRTTDGGNSWTSISGNAPNSLPELPINTVTFDLLNPNKIYIGTDLGIFISTNSGQSWTASQGTNGTVNPANVEITRLFWAGDDLIAATHGRGMFMVNNPETIYVDANAAPGGDGSVNSPFQTISQALNIAQSNNRILIKGNTYQEAPLIFSTKGVIQNHGGRVTIQ